MYHLYGHLELFDSFSSKFGWGGDMYSDTEMNSESLVSPGERMLGAVFAGILRSASLSFFHYCLRPSSVSLFLLSLPKIYGKSSNRKVAKFCKRREAGSNHCLQG